MRAIRDVATDIEPEEADDRADELRIEKKDFEQARETLEAQR
jgi:hypothetical protein